MGWFKRNLFFAIGGLVALGLLGAAVYYDYVSWSDNQAELTKWTDMYNRIAQLTQHKPQPGGGQTDNIAAALDQDHQVRQWIRQTTNYFQPIAPIPRPVNGQLTSESFGSALHRTVAQLQNDAAAANVTLPPQYDFSFSAHMDRLTFAPGSLEPLSVQLGEVAAISEILFASGINTLEGIQRYRASPDDAGGPATDYLDEQPITIDLAVMTPYEVTFHGFSAEIARVLQAFATSPHGFIIKSISVQPAGASTAAGGAGAIDQTPPPSAPASPPGKGGYQTVLDEQLLRVTLEVEVVKLAPRI